MKERLGMESRAFEFSVRNSDIYSGVGGYSYTDADLNWESRRCREYDMFGIAPHCDPSHPMYGLDDNVIPGRESKKRMCPVGHILK